MSNDKHYPAPAINSAAPLRSPLSEIEARLDRQSQILDQFRQDIAYNRDEIAALKRRRWWDSIVAGIDWVASLFWGKDEGDGGVA